MSKKSFRYLSLALVTALTVQARAELCTIDAVPAASLLLPYFEVDLANPLGVTTLFSINNASAAAALAHVTLWTDQSVPTLDFDVYLTGYDIQTLNVRDIFTGILPRTADDARDPTDSISPHGEGDWGGGEATFPGCGTSLPYENPALAPILITHLREAHTGGLSPVYGRCAGSDYDDDIARGYITIDVVNQCNLEFPSAPGYFAPGGTGLASNRNTLLGDFFFVDQANNFAHGDTLVHIEACDTPGVGQGSDECPFVAGDYTFYGRYVGATATDGREPLPTQFFTRFLNGGTFTGGTSLVVWRDSKTVATTGHSCGADESWFPLNQADVVAVDEQENCIDLCFRGSNVSPPIGGTSTCFPAETQKVSLQDSIVPGGADLAELPLFGGLFLNLNTTVSGGAFGPTAQAWTIAVMDANARYSVGLAAFQLDSACDTNGTSGVILIPNP